MIGSKTLGAATTLSKRNIHAVAFALLFVTCKPLVSTELCNQVSDFVTVALTSSFIGQLVGMALLIRAPIEWILRFEHPIVTISMVLNGFTGM